ncbi:hypothetical protein GQ457_05G017990 [Hibiscus cannabinus]
MERLPRDVVLDILSRLPVTTLAQSKSVCRSWQSIIQGSVLVDKHLSRMSEPKNDPCLIFQSPPPLLDHYYFVDFAAYSERHKRLKSFWVSTMHGKLVASSNGLLCFCSSSAIHICNPLTRDSVQLPKLSSDPAELGILGFGFSPTTKEYKVIDIIYQRQKLSSDSHLAPFQSKVQIFTLGDSQWRSLGMAPYQFIARQSQVTASGRLHWTSQPGEDLMKDRIISFDLTADCGFDIWVMKEYNVKVSWVKEFIIGGYLPKELRSTNGRIPFLKPDFRVVCSFKGGKILLKLWRNDLVLYDPVHEKFEDPMFEGALQWHEMVVHVGSLVLILLYGLTIHALRGHLCVVASNASCGFDICVMKEYNVKESSVKEFIIGGYLPKELRSTNGRIPFFKPDFSVVRNFKGRKILQKLWWKEIVLYDSVHEKFEDPMFEGALQWHEMVVHVGSLVSI